MKGVLLLGGLGSRLWPLTTSVNKHLLPVYDKPLVFYSLSLLLLIGVKKVAAVVNPSDVVAFRTLLGSGSQLGLDITYIEQQEPLGIAQIPTLVEDFTAGEKFVLALGDNIFFGAGLVERLKRVWNEFNSGAVAFSYRVENPHEFGVVVLSENGEVIKLVEKPKEWVSDRALVGLYFLDGSAGERASKLSISSRGEYEIVDLLISYPDLQIASLGRGDFWLDTGSPAGLHKASSFVESVQSRQGLLIGSIHEAALSTGNISLNDLKKQIFGKKGQYFDLLARLLLNV